jgi:hypothetical protein
MYIMSTYIPMQTERTAIEQFYNLIIIMRNVKHISNAKQPYYYALLSMPCLYKI